MRENQRKTRTQTVGYLLRLRFLSLYDMHCIHIIRLKPLHIMLYKFGRPFGINEIYNARNKKGNRLK